MLFYNRELITVPFCLIIYQKYILICNKKKYNLLKIK